MSELTLALSPDITEALRIPVAEQQERLRIELALRLYQKDLLSFGKARELARLSKWDFHELLAQEGISRRYDAEELSVDLETLEKLD